VSGLRVARIACRAEPLAELGDRIASVAWASDGSALAAGSLSGQVVISDPTDGAVIELAAHELGALTVAWSPDRRLASGGQDGIVRIVDRTGEPLAEHKGSGWCESLAWAPGGGGCLGAAVGAQVILWHDGGQLETHDAPSTVASVAWSVDGRRLGAAAYGGILWFERGRAAPVSAFEWKGSLLALSVSPSGKLVAVGTQEGSVRVHRLWTGDDLEMSGYTGRITELAWNSSGDVLSVGDADSVTSWTFRGRGPAGSRPDVLGGHGGRVLSLACAPSGRGAERIITGCADGRLRLYSGTDRSAPLAEIDVGAAVASLAWSPTGDSVAFGDAEGRLWLAEVAP